MHSDNLTFERIKEGDKVAFESLFRFHYAHLCAYANTFVCDKDNAEEIVQELFFQLWQKRETIQIQTSLKSYLFRAIHNSSLNFIKKNNLHRSYTEAALYEQKEDFQEAVVPMEASELENHIRIAIDKLPMERRKVFTMSRFRNMKYIEIAQELGISIKTVENQMGKALKFLREELKDFIPLLLMIFFKNN